MSDCSKCGRAIVRDMVLLGQSDNRQTMHACCAALHLSDAISEHHRQKADDRCREDDDKLYAAAGLPIVDRGVGDKHAMLWNCARFIERRCTGGSWPTYVEVEADRDGWRERCLEAERDLAIAGVRGSPPPGGTEATIPRLVRQLREARVLLRAMLDSRPLDLIEKIRVFLHESQ